jgi:ADP-ribose pyrophosphatase
VVLTPNHIYTTISRRYVWQSRWYNVRQDQLRQTDGREFTYTIIEKPGAVWVVPVTAEGDLILINQYRYPVGEWCLEVPAGNIEPGMAPAEMAARELREEIGGTAGRILPVAEFYTMNGIGDEIANVFLALDVVLGDAAREVTEHIELIQVPVREALDMARAGALKDGPSALAILLCAAALYDLLPEIYA